MAKEVEKNGAELLADKLLYKRQHGMLQVTDAEMEQAFDFCDGYKDFLNRAKTERESVAYAVAKAEKAGFLPFDPTKKYRAGDKVYYNNRGKAMCLAVIGTESLETGVKIVAAHIDCPRVDLKPIPLYEANEMAMLKTHYYGGIKKYQWVAMPLAMHGTVMRRDGSAVEICIGEKPDEPKLCITDLLPHLGKDQMAKTMSEGITGEDLNILAGSLPASREKGEKLFKLNVLRILNEKYGIVEEDLVSAEISFVPAFAASDVGLDSSLIGAYGHDDRVCAYPALEAVFNAKQPKQTVVTVLADKEEIGSMGNTGLASDFLRYFITDLAEAQGLQARHVLSKSTCLSADVTAAYDPNYASAYEAENSCYINRGIGVSKYTGSRGKSGSNDASAEFVSDVRSLFTENHVLWQIGELGKVDQGGGGTVALHVAAMNVDVIDVGVPVLSMHSPFEVVSKLDVYMTYKAFLTYYEK